MTPAPRVKIVPGDVALPFIRGPLGQFVTVADDGTTLARLHAAVILATKTATLLARHGISPSLVASS